MLSAGLIQNQSGGFVFSSFYTRYDMACEKEQDSFPLIPQIIAEY